MFERPTYAAFENNRSVDVCVVTTSVRERNVDVVVETRNGSATGEMLTQELLRHMKSLLHVHVLRIQISNHKWLYLFTSKLYLFVLRVCRS